MNSATDPQVPGAYYYAPLKDNGTLQSWLGTAGGTVGSVVGSDIGGAMGGAIGAAAGGATIGTRRHPCRCGDWSVRWSKGRGRSR